MPNRRRLVPALLITLLLALSSGLLLADQVNPTPEPPLPAPVPAALDLWPVLRHDHGHSGYNPSVGSFRPPLTELDQFELQEPTGEAFQVLDLVAGPQRLYALSLYVIWGVDKDDPASQWRNDDCFPPEGSTDFCFNEYMAYVEDRLVLIRQNFFLSTLDFGYELTILNAATGQEIWSRDLGTEKPEAALEGSAILLLVEGASGGRLLKLQLSGSQQYIRAADIDGAPSGAAVVAGGRFVYPRGGRILAYNTDTGLQAWPPYTPTHHVDPHGYDLAATADALIISQADRVIQLATADGAFRWETDVRSAVCDTTLQPNGAATNGQVVAVTAVCDKEVVVLDYTTGAEKWRKDLGQVGSAAAIAFGGDVLYVAGITPSPQAFSVLALDPEDGTELGSIVLNGIDDGGFDTSSVLAISDGLLLMASNIGSRTVYRYEREPADVAASLLPGSPPACGAAVGATVSFNFEITNNGPGSTHATRADLTLPDGTATIEASQGSCTSGAAPFCELGALANGQTVSITATVMLDTAGSYAPGITASGQVRDPDHSNDSASTTLTVDPAVPPNFDLTLADIEITQGVQNLSNNLLLVKDKTTFVRVYGVTNGGAVSNVSASLHGERFLTGEDLGTLSPIGSTACLSVDDTTDRDRLTDSFVFKLPENWVEAGVHFTAEIDPGGNIPETDNNNNTLEIGRPFIPLPRVCLMTYPVRTTGKPTGSESETDNLSPHFQAIFRDDGNILSRALTLLPTSEIKVFPISHKIEEWEPFAFGGWGPYEMEKEEDNRGDVLDTLWWLNLFSDDPDECDDEGARTHYVGMVHEGTTNSVGSAGLGIRDGDELMLFLNTGPNGPQRFDDPHGGLTLAHEIGHNYDRGHVDCDDPEDPDPDYPYDPCSFASGHPRGYYGLEFRDPTAPVVITPTMAGDVMSYADDVWTSDYTWDAIQGKLCEASDCLSAAAAPSPAKPLVDPLTGDILIMRGWITPTLAIQDLLRLPVDQVPKADEMWAKQDASRPLTAPYALNLIGDTTLLYSEPFSPTESSDQLTARYSFGLVVPWITETTSIELTISGTVALSLTVSPSPPTVTAVSPNSGETFTDTLPVSWSASDPDGDELRYSVLYSPDGGGRWQALATGVETTTISIDASLLPGSPGQGLVKVIASDGLNTAFRQSAGGFTLPDRPPLVAIYFPDDGGEYASGSNLTLQGGVFDPEDGYLPTEVMSWTLSGHGFLGTGNNIELPGLEDGDYVLTLTAAGQSSHVSFRIGELAESRRAYLPLIVRD